jgi:hypothetical protein
MSTGRNASTGPARPTPSASEPQPHWKKEQVHKRRGRRDKEAAEGDEQQQEAQADDDSDEERQLGGDDGGEVAEDRRRAADQHAQAAAFLRRWDHIGAQVLDKVTGAGVLWSSRGNDLYDRHLGALLGWEGSNGGNTRNGLQGLGQRAERGDVGRIADLGHQQQGSVGPRAEARRQQVVGLAGGGSGRVVAGIGEA